MRHWSLKGAIERVIQISRIWENRAAVAKTKFHGKHLVIAAGFPASDLIGLERIWIGWSEFGSDWIWIGSSGTGAPRAPMDIQDLEVVKLEKGITKHPLFSTSSAPYFLGT
jgi:hypothetical protein